MVVRRGQWAGGDTSPPHLAPLRPGPWLPAQPPGNQSSREGEGHQPRPPGTEDSEDRAALVSLTATPQWGTVPLPTLLLSELRCGEAAPGDLAFLPLALPAKLPSDGQEHIGATTERSLCSQQWRSISSP